MSAPDAQPPPPSAPGAGWYPDPELSDTQRYWDGSRWTEHRAPLAAAPESNAWLVGAGYVLSLIVVPGLIIGAALLARRDRNGPWVMALSLVFLALWIVAGVLGGDEESAIAPSLWR